MLNTCENSLNYELYNNDLYQVNYFYIFLILCGEPRTPERPSVRSSGGVALQRCTSRRPISHRAASNWKGASCGTTFWRSQRGRWQSTQGLRPNPGGITRKINLIQPPQSIIIRACNCLRRGEKLTPQTFCRLKPPSVFGGFISSLFFISPLE